MEKPLEWNLWLLRAMGAPKETKLLSTRINLAQQNLHWDIFTDMTSLGDCSILGLSPDCGSRLSLQGSLQHERGPWVQ